MSQKWIPPSHAAKKKDTESPLTAFYAYNPSLGEEGTEHEQVLFFYPEIPQQRQDALIGLSQGFVNFCSTFPKSSLCHSVRSDKHTFAFIHPEPEITLAIVLANPSEDDISASALDSLLNNFYSIFKLLNGSFQSIVESESWKALKRRLCTFATKFIPTVKFNKIQFYTDIHGILYMPLEPLMFLSIQSLAISLHPSFESLHSSIILFDQRLVYSSPQINQVDVLSIYRLGQDYFRPLIGELQSQCGDLIEICPEVYLSNEPKLKRLLVLQKSRFTIFLIFDSSSASMRVESLQQYLYPKLDALIPHFLEKAKQVRQNVDPFRFLYWNRVNLALKSSISSKGNPVPLTLFQAMQGIHDNFNYPNSESHQVYLKTRNDGWVVGKFGRETQREYFLLVDSSKEDIVECEEMVERLEQTYFRNICTL